MTPVQPPPDNTAAPSAEYVVHDFDLLNRHVEETYKARHKLTQLRGAEVFRSYAVSIAVILVAVSLGLLLLTFAYSLLSPNVQVLQGERGAPGAPGIPGAPGVPGAPGAPGAPEVAGGGNGNNVLAPQQDPPPISVEKIVEVVIASLGRVGEGVAPGAPEVAGGEIGNNVPAPQQDPPQVSAGIECAPVPEANVNRQDRQPDDRNAEVLIQIKWPDNHPDDIDLWVEDPNGEVVWYKSLRSGSMKLDRDDRGSFGEACVQVDGVWSRNPLNQETVSIRGIVPGEFVVNIHHYLATGTAEVPVQIKIEDVNPVTTPVFYVTLLLDHTGQELTAVRFNMDEEGRVLDLVTDQPKALVRN